MTGGIGAIQGFLRKASNLATAIFNFIGCDGKKCTTPSKWASSTKAALDTAADDWAKQVDNINFLDGVADDLAQFGRDANGEIDDFFGTDEFQDTEYNGMRIGDVLSATDAITGGDSAGQLDRALGSIESAIATTPLLGGTNSVFNACNQKLEIHKIKMILFECLWDIDMENVFHLKLELLDLVRVQRQSQL